MVTGEHPFDDTPGQRREAFDFLAPERQQKFDLLIHLLANLDQPVFLVGPVGIGKTTLLRQLHSRALPGWRICAMEASGQSTFEEVLQALARSPAMDAGSESRLSERLESMAGREEVVVLALDDAGRLMPGVLDALCRFAFHHPALRIVAALRPDDIHIKGRTDPWAVEEAHIIELPPLSQAQSQDYLQSLWNRMGKTLAPESRELQGVYGATHGIPENIRRYAQQRMGKPSVQWHGALARPVYLGLAVVVLAVMGVGWWQMHQPQEPRKANAVTAKRRMNAPATPESVATEAEVAHPAMLAPQEETERVSLMANDSRLPLPESGNVTPPKGEAGELSVAGGGGKTSSALTPIPLPLGEGIQDRAKASLSGKKGGQASAGGAGSDTPASDVTGSVLSIPDGAVAPPTDTPATGAEAVLAQTDQEQPAAEEGENGVSVPTVVTPSPSGGPGLRDPEWLMKQPPLYFTLQIAAFAKLDDLKDFAARHGRLSPLAFYYKRRHGRDWYPLLYGVFPSLEAAKKARSLLPPAIRRKKPWLRRLRSVQKEISRERSRRPD